MEIYITLLIPICLCRLNLCLLCYLLLDPVGVVKGDVFAEWWSVLLETSEMSLVTAFWKENTSLLENQTCTPATRPLSEATNEILFKSESTSTLILHPTNCSCLFQVNF